MKNILIDILIDIKYLYIMDNTNKNTNITKNIKTYDQMDENNKKALKVLTTKGTEEAIKYMFKHPTEKDSEGKAREMSYVEMRSFYG